MFLGVWGTTCFQTRRHQEFIAIQGDIENVEPTGVMNRLTFPKG